MQAAWGFVKDRVLTLSELSQATLARQMLLRRHKLPAIQSFKRAVLSEEGVILADA
jgi:hypothetical protein